MRSTFSILYYINRGKVKADGTTAIMCRITIDARAVYLLPDIIAILNAGIPKTER